MDISYLDDIIDDASETAQSNLMVPTLLVDCSYVTYHSMFSAWKTFSDQYSDLCPDEKDPNFDPTVHDEYKAILHERFDRAVMTAPAKVYPFIEPQNIVFARDCPKKDIWRINFFPEYKQERRDAKDDDRPFKFSGTFKYIYETIIPQYESEGSICIGAPASEGDDVIATLIKNKVSDNFIILASDRDLLQLVTDGVVMINVAGDDITYARELELPQEALDEVDFDGKNYILIKAMMGDRSDGIPQIHKRCGKKTAIKYFFDKSLLQEKIIQDPNIPAIIQNNLKIMDFGFIPQEVNDAIMKAYNEAKAEGA
jgi:5'-3' exonuclease